MKCLDSGKKKRPIFLINLLFCFACSNAGRSFKNPISHTFYICIYIYMRPCKNIKSVCVFILCPLSFIFLLPASVHHTRPLALHTLIKKKKKKKKHNKNQSCVRLRVVLPTYMIHLAYHPAFVCFVDIYKKNNSGTDNSENTSSPYLHNMCSPIIM